MGRVSDKAGRFFERRTDRFLNLCFEDGGAAELKSYDIRHELPSVDDYMRLREACVIVSDHCKKLTETCALVRTEAPLSRPCFLPMKADQHP
ncbi:hypothetical protein GCM10007416_06850 [Kroppenstedtia guangzhouensis]|uniref:Uncharacterized protein n=1 Tax=Kroppenstedtia guangzhouensis TaxID=1274356 RepID=A0ABQ1G514_9BACL|nr:hypothetical protein GCM10007416_06850 [Kroppenstedtia guangzhouensis]